MTQWSGKTRGGLTGYRIFVFLIKFLPIYFAYLLLKFVAGYFLLFSDKKAIRFYFKEILGFQGCKVGKNIYRNYCLLGEMLIDKISLLTNRNNRFTFTYEGEEHLHRMASLGKGGLLIGAHIGNWEMAGQLLERVSPKMNVVMLEAEHQQIEKFLQGSLKKKSYHVIPICDDLSHLKAIDQALKQNEMVAIHGDRFLPGAATVEVNFMGRPALFPTGPLYLASKFQVPVSFVVTVKESKSHYHFYATPGMVYPYPSRLKERKQELTKMVQDYAAAIEYRLRQYPQQWFNYYQFWN